MVDVLFVVDRRGADHEALHRWVDGNDGVYDASWEAAEFTWPDRPPLSFYFYLDPTFEHDEALITLLMEMRGGIGPGLVRIVEPDL